MPPWRPFRLNFRRNNRPSRKGISSADFVFQNENQSGPTNYENVNATSTSTRIFSPSVSPLECVNDQIENDPFDADEENIEEDEDDDDYYFDYDPEFDPHEDHDYYLQDSSSPNSSTPHRHNNSPRTLLLSPLPIDSVRNFSKDSSDESETKLSRGGCDDEEVDGQHFFHRRSIPSRRDSTQRCSETTTAREATTCTTTNTTTNTTATTSLITGASSDDESKYDLEYSTPASAFESAVDWVVYSDTNNGSIHRNNRRRRRRRLRQEYPLPSQNQSTTSLEDVFNNHQDSTSVSPPSTPWQGFTNDNSNYTFGTGNNNSSDYYHNDDTNNLQESLIFPNELVPSSLSSIERNSEINNGKIGLGLVIPPPPPPSETVLRSPQSIRSNPGRETTAANTNSTPTIETPPSANTFAVRPIWANSNKRSSNYNIHSPSPPTSAPAPPTTASPGCHHRNPNIWHEQQSNNNNNNNNKSKPQRRASFHESPIIFPSNILSHLNSISQEEITTPSTPRRRCSSLPSINTPKSVQQYKEILGNSQNSGSSTNSNINSNSNSSLSLNETTVLHTAKLMQSSSSDRFGLSQDDNNIVDLDCNNGRLGRQEEEESPNQDTLTLSDFGMAGLGSTPSANSSFNAMMRRHDQNCYTDKEPNKMLRQFTSSSDLSHNSEPIISKASSHLATTRVKKRSDNVYKPCRNLSWPHHNTSPQRRWRHAHYKSNFCRRPLSHRRRRHKHQTYANGSAKKLDESIACLDDDELDALSAEVDGVNEPFIAAANELRTSIKLSQQNSIRSLSSSGSHQRFSTPKLNAVANEDSVNRNSDDARSDNGCTSIIAQTHNGSGRQSTSWRGRSICSNRNLSSTSTYSSSSEVLAASSSSASSSSLSRSSSEHGHIYIFQTPDLERFKRALISQPLSNTSESFASATYNTSPFTAIPSQNSANDPATMVRPTSFPSPQASQLYDVLFNSRFTQQEILDQHSKQTLESYQWIPALSRPHNKSSSNEASFDYSPLCSSSSVVWIGRGIGRNVLESRTSGIKPAILDDSSIDYNDNEIISLFSHDGLFPPRDDEMQVPVWSLCMPMLWVQSQQWGSRKGRERVDLVHYGYDSLTTEERPTTTTEN